MKRTVVVAGGPPATAAAVAGQGYEVTLLALADVPDDEAAACRAAGVEIVVAPELDVRVTSRWLHDGYRLYRALAARPCDAVIFDGNAGDGYSVVRAKQTGSALAETDVVLRIDTPALRLLRTQTFLEHRLLGAAVTERLTLSLADALVCGRETAASLRAEGWTLPPQVIEVVAGEDDGFARALAAPSTRTQASAHDESLVSVVIPLYDRTTFLPQCLGSLARQDYAHLEVVIADDGSSTPETTTFLDGLEQQTWPWPLRVVRLAHGGLASARNGGWRAASGDLVLFLDDDDAAFEDLVTRTVRARHVAGADVVVAGARTFNGQEAPTPRAGDRVTISHCDPGELTLLGNHSGGPTCLWSRAWLEHLDGFAPEPRVVEDWHILVRASLAGARITTPPDPAWWYRRTPTSMYGSDPGGAVDAALPSIAGLVADTLPSNARILPHLAAGAYRELERREAAAPPSAQPLPRRARVAAARVARRLGRRR